MAGDLRSPDSEGSETAIGGIEPVDAEETAGVHSLPRAPARAREMLAMFSEFRPLPSPLTEKLTAEHISKMLEINRERVGNERAAERGDRYFRTVMFMVLCAFILSLVHMLLAAGNDQLTEKILIGLVTLVAGVAGGYGVGKSRC